MEGRTRECSFIILANKQTHWTSFCFPVSLYVMSDFVSINVMSYHVPDTMLGVLPIISYWMIETNMYQSRLVIWAI